MLTNDIEKGTNQEIINFQQRELSKLLIYLNNSSPYYKKMFNQFDIDIQYIKTIEDLLKIPVTTKKDLQLCNEEFLCVQPRKIIDYVNTSGTMGTPVNIALTNADLERLAYNEFLSMTCAGITEDDVIQLTTTIDKRFMAGMAYFLGARKIGAGIIRTGVGIPQMQWDNIIKLKPTVIIGIPSFLLKMIEYAEKNQIDFQDSSVKKLICIGENIRDTNFKLNSLGKRIQDKWSNVMLHSSYASTEMGAAFTECEFGQGGHSHPELLIIEILDKNNQPVKDGQSGELVITTLGIEAMPLLRFKTGDICIKHIQKCPCGKETSRLSPILGRENQMLKLKGTTVYPQYIYDTLNELDSVNGYVIEASTNDYETDELMIYLGVNDFSEHHHSFVKESLKSKLRVTPSITFKTFSEIQKMQFSENSRKPIMFIDNRVLEQTIN